MPEPDPSTPPETPGAAAVPPSEPSEPSGSSGPPGADGRARLLAALRKPGSRGQVVAGLLLAAVGFAAVTQVQANRKDDAYVGARQGDLVQLINTLSLASDRAQSQITKLERTRDALGNDTEARRTALLRARQQADTLGILAGTMPAEGPGVRVTVSDKNTGVGTNQLIDGLQELRDAGAEVIELNDSVRVVAQTYLQDTTGGGVLADGTPLRPPFVIDAIGDPHTLATALDFTGGFISEIRGVGATVKVQRLAKVEITSLHKVQAPKYAEPGLTR